MPKTAKLIALPDAKGGPKLSMDARQFRQWFFDKSQEAREKGQMISEVRHVTKEIADYLIRNHNSDNRPLKRNRLDLMKKILTGGQFKLTSQGFSISNEIPPRINNGQHRLQAIIETDIEVDVLFTFGEPRDVFGVLDQGTRNVDDAVAIKYPDIARSEINPIATAAQLFQRLLDRDMKQAFRPADVLAMLEMYPQLLDPRIRAAARDAYSKIKGWGVHMALLASFTMLTRAYKGKEAAEVYAAIPTFAEKLKTGANESSKSPILILRDALMAETIGEDYTGRERAACIAAAICISFDLWRKRKPSGVRKMHAYVPTDPFPINLG